MGSDSKGERFLVEFSALKEHTHHDNTPTSEEIAKEIHKDIGNKTFRYKKVEAHEQKLYKDALMWKQRVNSKW